MSDSEKKDDNIVYLNFGAAKQETPEPPKEKEPPTLETSKKIKAFSEALEYGTTMVTLDARRDGVIVPQQFKDVPNLNLNYDYRYGIKDFSFDEDGIHATLSFAGKNHYCSIEWDAVFAIHYPNDETISIFKDSIPKDLRK